MQSPIAYAAAAVAGTIALASVVVHQWIIPTVTASLDHQIELLKEEIAEKDESHSVASRRDRQLIREVEAELNEARKEVSELTERNKSLKDLLFDTQMANMFLIGNPYPIGLDKIKIGDPFDTVPTVFEGAELSESGRHFAVRGANSIFLLIGYSGYASNDGSKVIESIKYDMANYLRYADDSLPEVPDLWLEKTLERVLGKPYVVGLDNDCFLWKPDDDTLVYHERDSDWFEVSGFVTYPAGCSVSKEQSKQWKKSPATPQPN